MRKADRLFQLVNMIGVHQPICAQTLASRIGVGLLPYDGQSNVRGPG